MTSVVRDELPFLRNVDLKFRRGLGNFVMKTSTADITCYVVIDITSSLFSFVIYFFIFL